ncbi:hypothetical protein [Geobacter sp. DSM 9736]|uniref:hypothetical protein n=1 Tax=Geobacter sp. DSM 9736 TaxID=1277350 RepID=UPI000B50EB35|nr:hypothetical protein [Geobacter sp. DSM 9736]SNB48049.1 hypothetical protein SAMN06269301_3543 [Geobacter sp. DSM 9736]
MADKPEVTFKYVFSYNYNPVYVNGAHGGVSPRGEIVVNFYLERPALPNSITHEINPNGTIGSETAQEPEDLKNSLVRFVSDGVILNYESARNIHHWLGERIKELEAIERAKANLQFGQEPSGGVTH